jgi:hypothetical protein
MDKIMITIPLDEYRALVRVSEKIDIVERMVNKGGYVSTGDIMTVLGIKEKIKENNNEAV